MTKMGVYRISCDQSGKGYVGSARSIQRRKSVHLRMLRRGAHHSPHLQRAWNMYGESAFAFDVLEVVDAVGLLRDREQFWITALDSVEDGYNIKKNANNLEAFSEMRCRNISSALTGRTRSDAERKALSDGHMGIKPSDATRAKMVEAQRQRRAAEWIKKMNFEGATSLSRDVPPIVRD